MSGEAVQVVGDDRLRVTLAKAAADMEHPERAQQATGRAIQTRAMARAPKVTGRLAGSIHVTTEGDTVSVGTGLIYAGVIHNGWAAHNIAANPFLFPTADDTQPVWREFYVAEVNQDLAQVKGA